MNDREPTAAQCSLLLAALLALVAAIAVDLGLDARDQRDRADACERGRIDREWGLP